jgi:hypothetical protein
MAAEAILSLLRLVIYTTYAVARVIGRIGLRQHGTCRFPVLGFFARRAKTPNTIKREYLSAEGKMLTA